MSNRAGPGFSEGGVGGEAGARPGAGPAGPGLGAKILGC